MAFPTYTIGSFKGPSILKHSSEDPTLTFSFGSFCKTRNHLTFERPFEVFYGAYDEIGNPLFFKTEKFPFSENRFFSVATSKNLGDCLDRTSSIVFELFVDGKQHGCTLELPKSAIESEFYGRQPTFIDYDCGNNRLTLNLVTTNDGRIYNVVPKEASTSEINPRESSSSDILRTPDYFKGLLKSDISSGNEGDEERSSSSSSTASLTPEKVNSPLQSSIEEEEGAFKNSDSGEMSEPEGWVVLAEGKEGVSSSVKNSASGEMNETEDWVVFENLPEDDRQ